MRSKTWLVARHEFAVTTGRIGFRIFAAAAPALALLILIGAGVFDAVRGGDEPAAVAEDASATTRVGYVDASIDADGRPLFTSFREQDGVTFAPYADEDAGRAALEAGAIAALYVFGSDFLTDGHIRLIRMEDGGEGAGGEALRRFVISNLAAGAVSGQRLERIVSLYAVSTVELSVGGMEADDTDDFDEAEFLFSLGAGIMLIISALTAAGYLLQGLSEEKENRIMEVLLSSLRPEQLMFGKLLGLGAAGLLQMTVWTGSLIAFALLLGRIVELPVELRAPSIGTGALALAYFLLGYAFLGTLQAALGVITTSQKEANNIAVFVVLPAVSPMWFIAVLIENPDGLLARVMSLVPFTAPLTGLIRFGSGGADIWDVGVSLGVLAAFTALAALLTARLFRAYLLMYGQRPRVGQILRTLWSG